MDKFTSPKRQKRGPARRQNTLHAALHAARRAGCSTLQGLRTKNPRFTTLQSGIAVIIEMLMDMTAHRRQPAFTATHPQTTTPALETMLNKA